MTTNETVEEYKKKMLDKNFVLFLDKFEYIDFLTGFGVLMTGYHEGGCKIIRNTRFNCIEDLEYFFGIFYGEDTGDGDCDVYDVRIKNEEKFPTSYPCLLATYSLSCMSDGHSQVNFTDDPEFIYLKDFTREDKDEQ